jgi:hypothetical protein
MKTYSKITLRGGGTPPLSPARITYPPPPYGIGYRIGICWRLRADGGDWILVWYVGMYKKKDRPLAVQ